jgi:hypothetical protein
MHSSTSSFERSIPTFGRLILVVALLSLAIVLAWEFYCRSLGYGPTLNDTSDLWAIQRKKVQPDSLVIIGSSRALYDLDLDEIEKGLGKRPIQLALVGSCAYPVLENLANDASFHGELIVDVVPLLMMVPQGPPLENSFKALRRYREQTVAQRSSQLLGMLLEDHLAFLKQEDLTLGAYLQELPVPNRASAHLPPRLPPYFYSLDRDRRARMFEPAAHPGKLQTRIQLGWLPLFSPPPPPNWMPPEVFGRAMQGLVEARFQNISAAVEKIRSRGGKVVFARLPVSGKLKEVEDAASPKAGIWARILHDSKAPGIYFEEFPELAGFSCPEWSHLNASDSVEFTKRLVPHLQKAFGRQI